MRKIHVVGLGYLGLPVEVAFGNKAEVIGFDINRNRSQELKIEHERTGEVMDTELARTRIRFTSGIADLKRADFHIVAVPTPMEEAKKSRRTYVN